jgi:hypothetical protein
VGWQIRKVLMCENVSADTYEDSNDAREFFEQAEIDGFVAHFHRRVRESIWRRGRRRLQIAGGRGGRDRPRRRVFFMASPR